MSTTTIVMPPDNNSGEAFDHVEGPTHKNNQAAYHTHSQGPAPPPAPETTRSCRPSGPANPPPEDDTTSDCHPHQLASCYSSQLRGRDHHIAKSDRHPHQSESALDEQTRPYHVYAPQRDGSQ